jgi:hypothetical protein
MFNKKLLSSIDLGKYTKKNPYKKDMILDPMGQWKHPGKNTRIPSDRITMKGVNYPVLGVSNTGQKQMMQPGREYNFPGADYVDEYPQMKKGGLPKAQKGAATYQDSLDVYNNALKLKAYYDSKKQYYDVTTNPWYDIGDLKGEEKATYAYDTRPDNSSIVKSWTPQQKRNFQKTKNLIKANKDPNIAYITDIVTGALDPDSPALRYDNRIKPQSKITYEPYRAKYSKSENSLFDKLQKKYDGMSSYGDPRFPTLAPSKQVILDFVKKNGYSQKDAENLLYKLKKENLATANTPGVLTELPYYDPLAIKPGRLLTDDEIKKRVKKYGTTGIPQDRLDKLGLKNSNPPKKSTSSTVTKSPCSNPITTVINNIPEKIPFGKKLVGTDEETLPVTGKKCEYVKTINPIYENITIDPIKPPAFPLRIESGNLPPLQSSSFDLPETIEAPQYVLDPYTADRLSLDVKLPQNKIARLFDRGVIDSKGHIELGKKNKTRLIPRIVQKVTGYDPAYFEGSYDEEGNFVPGELDYGNATGSEIEFRGAASLRDYMNQQKYKKEYEEYDKKLDEWFEKYEQSKKKQEEGRAFKKGGAKKRIYNPNAKYYADGGENLQEECPPYHYWNGETCVPVSRELAPLDPQYLSENPDVATNMQIEPEVSVSPLGSDFSKAKSWIDKWHDSPMHDKMLMKSLKLSNQEKLFKEYKDKRKKNIQTIPALNIDFNKTSPDVKAYEDKYGINLWGMSHGNTGAVSIFNSHPGNKQMLIHEISHSSDRPDNKLGRLIPYNDQLTIQYRTPLNWKNSQYGKDIMKEYKEKGWRLDDEYMGEEEIPRDIYEQQQFDDWNKYLLGDQGTEVRARLNEIRQGAQEKNIYDPFNKKITGRQFKNLKNLKYPKPLNELRKTFSDKDIRWMLNNISKNNNETEDAIQYGKKGGAKKKYTSDIINSTNYLFAEHPLFKKKKQSKKRIYSPNAKYYQLGGLTRFVPQAGRMFALPPITNTIANTAPDILNSIKTISQKLPTNLLDEAARDLLHYPSFDVTLGESNLTGVDAAKYLGDFGFKPYSEGWTALSDMKNAFEGKQWNPSKEDYYTLDEIYNLINKQTNYLNDLAKFNETNPDELGEYGNLLRWMQNDFSRDELFSLLFPNSSRPNFKEKFYRPEHINLLKQTTPNPETGINLYDNLIKNTNFGDKGLVDKYTLRRSITEPNTEILPGSEDLMLYRQRYEPYRGLDAGNLSERKDVIEFLKDHDGILGFEFKDLNNEYSNNLNYWKEQIFEKFDNQEYKKFQNKFKEQSKPGTSPKLKGLDAYNQIINRTGSRNKYGGELPKGKYGHSVGNLIRKQFGGEQDAMNAMMKARLAYANMFGNPSAQRMINIPDQPYEFDNGDTGTHYMASMDNYAVPQIQDKNGQLMLGNYGPESREAIRFDSDEDANYFAENYKDVSPGFMDLELDDDEIEEYKKGGYIVEDISVPRLQPGGLVKTVKGITEGVKNINNAKNIPSPSSLLKNISKIAIEGAGELLMGKQNREAIAKGNEWLKNWISHPVTQAKIQGDIFNANFNPIVSPKKNYLVKYFTPVKGDLVMTEHDRYINALELAKRYKPNVGEYSFKDQFKDLLSGKDQSLSNSRFEHIHDDNAGVTYMHQSDPINRELYKSGYYKPNFRVIDPNYKPFRHYGSFTSRNPNISPYGKESITIHEGTHDWITDYLLNNTGQKDLILDALDPEVKKVWEKWKAGDKTLTKAEENLGYYADPTEIHARIMQLRRQNDLTPFDIISDENSGYFMDQILSNKVPFNGPQFAKTIGNDRNKLAKLMNDLYGIALPVGVATGAGAMLANPYADKSPISKYPDGGIKKAIKSLIKRANPKKPKIESIGKLLKLPNTPTARFVSEIDWGKWNPETPNYPELITEYNAIEEFNKTRGTWMKNPDGTPYQGTPEQFIQEQSSHFKKAFPEGYNEVFRGVDNTNAFSDFTKSTNPNLIGDKAIFTADKKLASGYTGPKVSPIQMLNPFIEDNNRGLYNLIYPKGKQITYNTDLDDWADISLAKSSSKENILARLNASKKHYEKLKSVATSLDPKFRDDILKQQEEIINRLQSSYDNFGNIVTDHEAFAEMRKVLGDSTYTDAIAAYLPKTDLRSVTLQNLIDGDIGNVTIVNNRPGNYLKSRIGNVGFFNMNNPNIYKSLAPLAIGAGAGALMANPYTDESPIGEYQTGGEYQLGDEVDEATMKKLKKLGFTFEQI